MDGAQVQKHPPQFVNVIRFQNMFANSVRVIAKGRNDLFEIDILYGGLVMLQSADCYQFSIIIWVELCEPEHDWKQWPKFKRVFFFNHSFHRPNEKHICLISSFDKGSSRELSASSVFELVLWPR